MNKAKEPKLNEMMDKMRITDENRTLIIDIEKTAGPAAAADFLLTLYDSTTKD